MHFQQEFFYLFKLLVTLWSQGGLRAAGSGSAYTSQDQVLVAFTDHAAATKCSPSQSLNWFRLMRCGDHVPKSREGPGFLTEHMAFEDCGFLNPITQRHRVKEKQQDVFFFPDGKPVLLNRQWFQLEESHVAITFWNSCCLDSMSKFSLLTCMAPAVVVTQHVFLVVVTVGSFNAFSGGDRRRHVR